MKKMEGKKTVETGSDIILFQNIPDPFDRKTEIRFFIPEGGIYKLNIYNSKKEIIRTLKDDYLVSGTYKFTWDGISSDGSYAEEGSYNFSLEGNGSFSVRKLHFKKGKTKILNRVLNILK